MLSSSYTFLNAQRQFSQMNIIITLLFPQRCDNFMSVNNIHGLTSLVCLVINRCHNLLKVPDLHNQSQSLRRLEITDCQKLTSLPHEFDTLSLLRLERGSFSLELHSFPSIERASYFRIESLVLLGFNTQRSKAFHFADILYHIWIWNRGITFVVKKYVIYPSYDVR